MERRGRAPWPAPGRVPPERPVPRDRPRRGQRAGTDRRPDVHAIPARRRGARVSHAQVTLGCVVTPDLHPRGFLEVARAAERGGLEELWLWEDCLKQSAVATAGAMLGATRQLRVGIGILPVPLRNAALSAMDFATLAEMFPGRLVAGLGH